MNPEHLTMLKHVDAGDIAFDPDSREFRFRGSPVEHLTASYLEDLMTDEMIEVRERSEKLGLTDAGFAVLERE